MKMIVIALFIWLAPKRPSYLVQKSVFCLAKLSSEHSSQPTQNKPIKAVVEKETSQYAPKIKSSFASKAAQVLQDGVRINKCVVTLSRRAADDAIAQGRVTVNGVKATATQKIMPGDVVKLDGRSQKWEEVNVAKQNMQNMKKDLVERDFVYVKYFKPIGVTCTSDKADPSNVITKGKFFLFPQRLFTVGRLDKDSSGLLLLTSDGRVNNALLNKAYKQEKIYEVVTDKMVSADQLQKLREGVVISTPVQRERSSGKHQAMITAKTLPCKVDSLGGNKLRITLIEGRNRQIRRMAHAVGLNVVALHRVSFAGINMKGLQKENDWCELSQKEMEILQRAIKKRYGEGEGIVEDGNEDEDDDEE